MRPVFPTSALRQSVARPAIRSHRLPPFNATRFASSNTSATVEATQKKAQDAMGSLQKNAERLWATTKKILEPAGEKAGKMLGSYKQPIVYNLSVTRELVKHIYIAESLQPPLSLSTIQSAYATLWSRAISPVYWRGILSNGEIVRVGVYALEAYGIFKIGEILGRRHLVGYNLH